MISLSDLRKAFARQAGKLVGSDYQVPVHFESQRRMVGKLGEMKTLPLRPMCAGLNLDTGSSDFGKTWFIPGLHTPGDPNHPIKPSGVCE